MRGQDIDTCREEGHVETARDGGTAIGSPKHHGTLKTAKSENLRAVSLCELRALRGDRVVVTL